MENEKYKIDFEESATIIRAADDFLEFSNGITIETNHEQDCCESAWAEFSNLEIEKAISEKTKFKSLLIELLDQGFLINNMLVNSYSDNNGYYSDNLGLIVKNKHGEILLKIDVSDGHIDIQDG